MTATRRMTWDRYTSAWNTQTREAKLAALAGSAAPGCRYLDPQSEAVGHDALTETMLAFHRQVPGGRFETLQFFSHHDRSVARWRMLDGAGAALGEGISVGEYDGSGLLVSMTGFFDAPPAP